MLFSSALPPRIGIIGGGIGGTSCAYFLRSLFGDDVTLDLYEADKLGGRLCDVPFGAMNFEVGGSVIHPRNRYMSGFLNLLDLTKRDQRSDTYLGLYNGNRFVFQESTWQIVTLFKLLKRYHFGIWKLKNHINDLLDKFDNIYKYQDDGVTFDNVPSLLAAMDPECVEYLRISARKGFENLRLPENVINELVMATLRTNYGQDLRVHKFVGSVSVAGASDGLRNINGGNARVTEKLLHLSQANLIQSTVSSIQRLPTKEMEIFTSKFNSTGRKYDIVIVAAPQTSDMKHQIHFKNFKNNIQFPGKYHQTVCTLIKGRLRDSYFRDMKKCIDSVLSIDVSTFFNFVGRIESVDFCKKTSGPSGVWKVFSQNILTESELTSLFAEINDKFVKVWLAYPEYDTSVRDDNFVLDHNLYHVNAIEWAASSIEMSVIGARNVALLAFHSWREKEKYFDCDINTNERDEF